MNHQIQYDILFPVVIWNCVIFMYREVTSVIKFTCEYMYLSHWVANMQMLFFYFDRNL